LYLGEESATISSIIKFDIFHKEERTKMRKIIVVACMVFLIGGVAAFAQTNEPPPSGAILDLNGTPIYDTSTYYSVDFTAALANTDITFAFREDPSFLSFSNASVVDVTNPSGNLLLNGNFALGSGTNATDWTYANIYGASDGGQVNSSSCGGGLSTCWYDGAVQAYDAIDQTIATNIGDTYLLSFDLSDPNAGSTFSDLSTNGNTTGTGGNGIDALAYAQAGLPPAGTTPEPSSIILFSTGLVALVGAARRKMARN
jgi:hypothetical protein